MVAPQSLLEFAVGATDANSGSAVNNQAVVDQALVDEAYAGDGNDPSTVSGDTSAQSANRESGESSDSKTAPLDAAEQPELPKPRVTDRSQWYISQENDSQLKGFWFACGATSLTMAMADFGVAPANESTRQRLINLKMNSDLGYVSTFDAGQFPGGANLMATFAEMNGLQAEGYEGSTDVNVIDRLLAEGKGVIVNVPNHFVYIAGKDANGYIVGDPSYPGVTHWSEADLQAKLDASPRKGFTSVWNGPLSGPRQAAPGLSPGDMPVPAVNRNGGDPAGYTGGGGNGSMLDNQYAGGGSPGMPSAGSSGGGGYPDVPAGSNTGQPTGQESQFLDDVWQSNPADALSIQNFTDGIVNAIAANPGAFEAVNAADGELGISVGLGMWNQSIGGLSELLQDFHDADSELFQSTFGTDWRQFLDEQWVRSLKPNHMAKHIAKLKAALKHPKFQDVQIEKTREHVSNAAETAYKAGFRSDEGMAAVVDLTNQLGTARVSQTLESLNIGNVISTQGERAAISTLTTNLRQGS